MATETEVFRAILEIEERGNMKAAAADVKAAEALMAELQAQFKAGAIAADQYYREVADLGAELVDLRMALAGVAASDADDFFERLGIQTDIAARTTRALSQSKGTLAGASRNSAGALLEFSRAAEDAQYGIAGVLNNIPGMLMQLGAGVGLTGVVSLAAVGVAQLVKHWDSLLGAFGSGKVETEAQEMERLAKATGLTVAETARLKKLKDADTEKKAAAAEVEAMGKEQSEAQKALGASIQKAFAENGGADGVRADMVRGEVDRRKAGGWYRKADGTDDSDAMTRDRKTLDDQIKETTRTAIHSNDSKKQGDAVKLLQSFAGGSGTGFDAALRATDPRAEKAREEAKAAAERKDRQLEQSIQKGEEDVARVKEAAQRRRADAGPHADRLDSGPLGGIADGGKLNQDQVERAMRRNGASAGDVSRLAPEVLDQLRQRSTSRVKEFAAARGLTLPDARKQMGRERALEEAKSIGVEGWRVGEGLPEDKSAEHEAGAASAMAALMRGGMSGGDAQRTIYNQLRGSMGDAKARVTARNATWDAAGEYDATRQKRNSTVVDSAGLADAIQNAVGGGDDWPRKQYDEQKKASASLQRIAAAADKPTAPRLRS